MQDMPAADQHLTVRSNAGHFVELRDTPVAVATVRTLAGHRLVMQDTAPRTLTAETPGGRRIVFDDATSQTTVTDPAVVNINAPRVNIAGDARGIARLNDTVQVVITGGSSAGTWNGTITSASGTAFTG